MDHHGDSLRRAPEHLQECLIKTWLKPQTEAGRAKPLSPDELKQPGVPESHAGQMSMCLKLNSEGNDNTMIKASQDRGSTGVMTRKDWAQSLPQQVESQTDCRKQYGNRSLGRARKALQRAPRNRTAGESQDKYLVGVLNGPQGTLQKFQHLRTNGPAPMISNVEEDENGADETIVTEDGELLRLERHNGQRVAATTNSKLQFQ